MLLLTTQALPQMREFRHPKLGRLLTPRHFPRLQDTLAEGFPTCADNDCFHKYSPDAITRMFATVAPIPSVLARIRRAWPQMNQRQANPARKVDGLHLGRRHQVGALARPLPPRRPRAVRGHPAGVPLLADPTRDLNAGNTPRPGLVAAGHTPSIHTI